MGHLRANGFEVREENTADLAPIKRRLQVPNALQGCHTAVAGDYVVEGHVPADDIKRMLKEKPAIAGLSAPGMPQGSPGMEQGAKEPYDVVAFTKDGKTTVFAKHK